MPRKGTVKIRGQFQRMTPLQLQRIMDDVLSGKTVQQIAKRLNVGASTVYNWLGKDSKVLEAFQKARQLQAENVAQRLYQNAMGAVVPDCSVNVVDKRVVVTPLLKHLAPNPIAQIFFLKNMQPDKWHDRKEVQQTHTISGVDGEVMARLKNAAKQRLTPQLPEQNVVEVKCEPVVTPPVPGPDDYAI